jgi:hypothetical protein
MKLIYGLLFFTSVAAFANPKAIQKSNEKVQDERRVASEPGDLVCMTSLVTTVMQTVSFGAEMAKCDGSKSFSLTSGPLGGSLVFALCCVSK